MTCKATLEIKQKLYSSAFNCMCFVVAKTQSEEKFYENFIFVEKINELFWSRVIDVGKSYRFDMNGKNENFKTVYLGSSGKMISYSNNRNRKLFQRNGRSASQYLTNSFLVSQSSLSQLNSSDSTWREYSQLSQKVDSYTSVEKNFDNAPPCSDIDALSESHENSNEYMGENGGVAGFDDVIIGMEVSDLNAQPCMAALVRVIQRMSVMFMDAWMNSYKSTNILPRWLSECRDKLTDYNDGGRENDISSKRIIRLFMLRLFINQPVASIVSTWAQELFPAVIECCTRDLCDPTVGTGYHYYLRDVVFTFCDTWKLVQPDAFTISAASRFLSHILQVAYSDDNITHLENKRSVCALIKTWIGGGKASSILTLDMSSISTMISAEAAPTGGAHAKPSSKGSESVKQVIKCCTLSLQ